MEFTIAKSIRFRGLDRQNRSTINKFYGAMEEHSRENPFVMDNDEPPVLLGTDKGANPVEQILHGLAGCITTTTVYYAAAKGIKIDEMETIFVGDLDLRGFLGLPGRTRNGYEQIQVTVRIKSDASDEEIRELVEITPESMRLRKMELDAAKRATLQKRAK